MSLHFPFSLKPNSKVISDSICSYSISPLHVLQNPISTAYYDVIVNTKLPSQTGPSISSSAVSNDHSSDLDMSNSNFGSVCFLI